MARTNCGRCGGALGNRASSCPSCWEADDIEIVGSFPVCDNADSTVNEHRLGWIADHYKTLAEASAAHREHVDGVDAVAADGFELTQPVRDNGYMNWEWTGRRAGRD
jgi:hypothetical protein